MINKIVKTPKTVLLTALLALTAGFTVFAITETVINNSQSKNKSTQLINNGTAMSGVYHPKSNTELLKELKDKQLSVTDRISAQITFQDGKQDSKGSWIVENPSSNKVTEQCSVVLDEKVIAISSPIKPGEHIEDITLLSPVSSGTYSVTVIVKYFDLKTSACLGQANYRNVKLAVL